ncbi:MAG: aldo/keto reductase, partial [Oscillospiraceae bacterium]|nr:aldo/keto reductase [Oscillospiraceae bacterium]
MGRARVTDSDGSVSVDRDKAIEISRHAVDSGVNFFDSAFTYHRSKSENVLGEALSGGYRDRVKIATKLHIRSVKETADIRRSIETTLERLKTDHIDFYLMHGLSGENWDNYRRMGFVEQYEQFRSEGMIGHIGFSFHGKLEGFKRIIGDYPWDMCMVQQNMLDMDRECTVGGIQLAADKGIAIVAMEPLRGGGLSGAPAPVKALYDAFPVKRSPVEWAFRHLIDLPGLSCVLSGMTTLDQLKDNIGIISKPDMLPNCLSSDEKQLIKEAKAAYESIVTIPCTTCEYCVPCPNNVNIPRVFSLYNSAMMFGKFDHPRRSYWFARNAGQDASHCTACGECEPKCPQNIKIIEQLKTAHKMLDGWDE